jgi:hypothetical protein
MKKADDDEKEAGDDMKKAGLERGGAHGALDEGVAANQR